MTNLTESNMSNAVKTFFERRLLMRAVPRLVHGRWGERATLNGYNALEWRRWGTLSAVTSALTEGTTPSEQSAISVTQVTATPSWYGSWIGFSDELNFTIYDPLLTETSGVLGEQAGVSFDTLIRNQITANATKRFSAGASARTDLDAPNMNVDYQDFLEAYSALQASNALPIEGQYFIVIIHPHTYASLMNDSVFVNLFTEAVNESGGSGLRSGYLGDILMCRIYVSSNAREYDNGGVGSTDVYSMLFIGKESYGVTGIANFLPDDVDMGGPEGLPLTGAGEAANPVEIITKQLGSSGSSDPLNQRATAGWKGALATSILNSAFIIDLEHTNLFSDA